MQLKGYIISSNYLSFNWVEQLVTNIWQKNRLYRIDTAYFFISMFLNYFLSELNFPKGLFLAKSTKIGAATKIEE